MHGAIKEMKELVEFITMSKSMLDKAFKNSFSHINKFSNPHTLHKEAATRGVL